MEWGKTIKICMLLLTKNTGNIAEMIYTTVYNKKYSWQR